MSETGPKRAETKSLQATSFYLARSACSAGISSKLPHNFADHGKLRHSTPGNVQFNCCLGPHLLTLSDSGCLAPLEMPWPPKDLLRGSSSSEKDWFPCSSAPLAFLQWTLGAHKSVLRISAAIQGKTRRHHRLLLDVYILFGILPAASVIDGTTPASDGPGLLMLRLESANASRRRRLSR